MELRFKWLPILIAFLLLLGSVGTYFSLPKGAIDNSSASSLSITLDYKPDTPVDEVRENGLKLEKFLMEQEGQDYVDMQMGNSADGATYGNVNSPTLVSYTVQMKDGADADKIIDAVKGQRANYPGADLNAGPARFSAEAHLRKYSLT
ncbi:hypothetical protein [Cohnella faecalis]|nr:hypothetical protein [Cohnella faecalis]